MGLCEKRCDTRLRRRSMSVGMDSDAGEETHTLLKPNGLFIASSVVVVVAGCCGDCHKKALLLYIGIVFQRVLNQFHSHRFGVFFLSALLPFLLFGRIFNRDFYASKKEPHPFSTLILIIPKCFSINMAILYSQKATISSFFCCLPFAWPCGWCRGITIYCATFLNSIAHAKLTDVRLCKESQ